MKLRVTKYGEPVLRQKGKPVESFDDSLKEFVDDMIETMREEEGVGLAAQQVDRPWQLFVLDVGSFSDLDALGFALDGKTMPLDLIMPMAMINTELEILDATSLEGEEGCLSFPGVTGIIPRAKTIRCRYQDVEGKPHVLEADEWFARVIQHEFDHTQGVLFIDYMGARELRRMDARLKRIKRDSRDWLKKNRKS